MLFHGFKNGKKLRNAQESWRATAKENCTGLNFFRRSLTNDFYLAAEGLHISGDELILPGVGVEIAIGTTMAAKGDVKIKGVFSHLFKEIQKHMRGG